MMRLKPWTKEILEEFISNFDATAHRKYRTMGLACSEEFAQELMAEVFMLGGNVVHFVNGTKMLVWQGNSLLHQISGPSRTMWIVNHRGMYRYLSWRSLQKRINTFKAL